MNRDLYNLKTTSVATKWHIHHKRDFALYLTLYENYFYMILVK